MPCNSLFYYIDIIPKLTFLDNKKEHPEVFLYELNGGDGNIEYEYLYLKSYCFYFKLPIH